MRILFISLVAFIAPACTSQDACRSIAIGSRIDNLPRFAVTANTDPAIRAMLRPVSQSRSGDNSDLVWDRGPAEAAMCCASSHEWCTAEQLQCADPALQGVTIYTLGPPYSDESRVPDDGTYCYVAERNGSIVAIWHRYWS